MHSFDWAATLLDEIALEGLDGITFQALWLRLENCRSPFFSQPLDKTIRDSIWSTIIKFKDVQFFELLDPRPPLVIFDWFCENENTTVEPPDVIYKHHPIDDIEHGIMGSCPTYNTRIEVTKEARKMSLDEAFAKWGQKLVMVASQKVRLHALVGPSADPFMELFCLPYCMLERIGRSRYNGEITNCKWSLQAMGLDPKNIFYHRKYLTKRKLICKQFFFVTSGSVFVNGNGNLLHLPRFFVEYESRMLFYLNVMVDHLKKSPNFTDTSLNIIRIIGNKGYRKRLVKSQEFSQLIHTETVSYQQYYPKATRRECLTSKGTEKEVRIMRLKYPDVNVREFFNQLHDDDDDEDEEEGDSMFFDEGKRLIDRSTLAQSYQVIEEAGPIGLSRVELSHKLGYNRVMSRIVMKTLHDHGYIDSVAVDRGKTRIIQYISLKYGKNTHERKKILQEQAKTAILLGTPKKKSNKRKEPITAKEAVAPKRAKLSTNETQNTVAVKMEGVIPVVEDTHSFMEIDNFDKGMEEGTASSFTEAQGSFSSQTTLDEASKDYQVSEEKVVDVSITPTPTYLEWDAKQILKKKLMSHRMFRRKNLILEAVQKEEIIMSFHLLKKKILKAEENDENSVQIDKKTLIKLVLRLEAEGHIKTYSYLLQAKSRHEKLVIICLPHITPDNHNIKNAIDHAKLRMSVVSKEKVKAASRFSQDKVIPITPIAPISGKSDPKNTAQDISSLSAVYLQNFRNVPKFVKVQLVHQLLYYLVHFYEGDENLDQMTIRSEIAGLADLHAIRDVTLPKVYYFSKDLNWKLFIPPSSKLAESHKGWITIGELVLRMPLSMLVQICSLNYLIPEIYDYLSHPVYKHILLKDLPITIRSALTFGRVYVMAIHRVLTLAAYLGLVQFGPHRHKDKDMVQVYLNRHSSLYNTTTSRRGYIHVSPDIEYPKITYHFQTMDDVNQYWVDAMMFCTNTQLGSREEMSGKSVVIETLDSKPDVVKSITERSFHEVEQHDTGEIPGDHKGAAGFDSAFYSHLKRNWHWSVSSQRKPIKLHPCLEANALQVKSESSSSGRIVVKKLKPKSTPSTATTCVPKQFVKKTQPRIKKFKEKTAYVKKPLYDEIDKRALASLRAERVTWAPEEDNVLLLIKVAALFFNQKNQRCISYYRMARDFLHQKFESSRNKTSRAAQRRLLHLSRRPEIAHVISVCNAENQADPSLQKRFAEALEFCAADPDKDVLEQGIVDKNIPLRNKTVLQAMVDLTEVLLKRYPRIYFSCFSSEDSLIQFIPDSIEEFKSMYSCTCPSLDSMITKPVLAYDIILSVIINLIYSSICCQSAKTSYSLQLFYAFKHYPEKYLRAALTKLQTEQMISRRKHNGKYSKMKVSSFLPISSSCYQLSNMYNIKLMCKYQHNTFRGAFDFNSELKSSQPVSIMEYDGGKAAILSSLTTSNIVDFEIEIPEQLIALNPAIEESRLGDTRLVTRMKNHFLGYGHRPGSSKKKEPCTKSDSEDSDSDFESSFFDNFPIGLQSSSKGNKGGKSSFITNLAQNFKSEDLFLVKGCQFTVGMKNESQPMVSMLQNDGSYLMVSMEEFQSRVTSVLENLKLTFMYTPLAEELVEKVISELNDDSNCAKEILSFIELRRDAGATSVEIGEKFGHSRCIYSILLTLMNNHIIVRSGTERIHYVHHKHSRTWLVHSFQMVRLDRESLDVEAISNVVKREAGSDIIEVDTIAHSEFDVEQLTVGEENETPGCSFEQKREMSENRVASDAEKTETRVSVKENKLDARRKGKDGNERRDKNSTQQDNFWKIKKLSENVKKQVQILIRPWVKPDGSLNRRVLDRFLGVVLSRAMEKPLCSLRSLQEKFLPLLEPAYVFELIELLEKIGCIVLKAKIVSGKVNLFSSSKSVKLVSATGLEKEEDMVICVSAHAVVTLSHFIGKTAYATDFMV